MESIIDFFLGPYSTTSLYDIFLEFLVFFFGIASVIYAKKKNILVFPTGLVATAISVYLLYKAGYFGDMTLNFYYSIMSIYGWYYWSRKKGDKTVLPITRTTTKEKLIGILLFLLTVIITYAVYIGFDHGIETVNYIDIFTSGLFFTAMWYMAKKKLENWTLWIIADIITVPLYAYRGLGILSLQYLIFTVLAVQGYYSWKKDINKTQQTS
ncbi:nicotinamide mononucleotide transporter [Arenibacter nanhaiticus]|uniref:Nicotinamide riboside transporter PnuC n=1 Tax=Arenibacter nanhaiticus TaxID=558155 RepID=A0A1M6JIZ8_9FLAO|nr:nicotinamide riboside transporter PnuC [Arenibacter nanhaiticus]SHJ46656.1 nicotinamide mononucleotide transporter [Arenibacter nanhaiticus]